MRTKKRVRSIIWRLSPDACILVGLCMCGSAWLMRGGWQASAKGEVHFVVSRERKTPDCGAASLYLISKLTGVSCTLEKAKKLTNTTMLGANMLDLQKAGERLGFKVNACVCGYPELCEHLRNSRNYAILYSPKGHYIAAIGLGKGNCVRIVDVGRGIFDLSLTDILLEYKWDGSALFFQQFDIHKRISTTERGGQSIGS